MVLKEAAGSEWSCSKNAHPTNFFAANQRAQTKIQTDCYPYCKQGTDKLSGGKSKKDGLLIALIGFFVDFAVSYTGKSSGTGESFPEPANTGEQVNISYGFLYHAPYLV